MKRYNNKFFKIALCIVLALSCVLQVKADSTSEKIDSVEEQMQESQKKLQETQESIQHIQENKDQLEGTLQDLNVEMDQLKSELTNLEVELKDKQKDISKTQQELDDAKTQEQAQYKDMKLRIKYMYEMKDMTFLEILMEGGSFADILNKAEYFSKVTEYDRDMLQSYKETKTAIEQKSADLAKEQQDLKDITAQVSNKQQSVAMLVAQTQTQVAEQQGDLDTAEAKAMEYEQQLEKQQDTLESLQEQEALERAVREAEERARRQAAASSGGAISGGASSNTEYNSGSEASISEGKFKIMTSYAGYDLANQSSTLDVLAAIIYCEAGAEPYEGKIAVGSVIMNRINSVAFPNSLVKVLFQKTQFTPVVSGRFYIVLESKKASSDSYRAAQEVIDGANNVPTCLFFRTVIPEKQGTIIGNHVFY